VSCSDLANNLVHGGRLRAPLLLSVLILGACSTRSGEGSSQPSDVGGAANSVPTSTEASTPPPAQTSAPTSTQLSSAPLPTEPPLLPPSQHEDGGISNVPAETTGQTPEELAAENCRKYPACIRLVCPSDQVPMQLAVCKSTHLAVCECIVRPTGR
jgi:hypothetical protein